MVDRSVWKVGMDPKKSEGRNFVRYPDRDMIQLNMEICWERWEDQRGPTLFGVVMWLYEVSLVAVPEGPFSLLHLHQGLSHVMTPID